MFAAFTTPDQRCVSAFICAVSSAALLPIGVPDRFFSFAL
jgi:hypothetical protein